ncbi:MAG TPA: SDR family NAD(P)-dependent oxidoreductase [Conexibacter sp.]|nr:SDR family NAD(P)-dependent oxidoreductase [Conexibacter sp.]
MNHTRRVAIVTGAAGGIGRAICERLLADGLDVLAVDLRADADPAPSPAPAAGSAAAIPFAADLATGDGNRAVVAEALRRFGRIDVVVANAGVQHVAPVAEFPEERWRTLLDLLLTSPFLLAKHAWPALVESPLASFVAVSSAHGLVASPGKSAYVAAKHGTIGLVKTLALEGAEHEITANAVCPGYVRTPLVERQVEALAERDGTTPERALADGLLAPHAIKRLIEPAEVADVVGLLAGPSGRAFSGAALTMDLGWTAR